MNEEMKNIEDTILRDLLSSSSELNIDELNTEYCEICKNECVSCSCVY
jgi:hypothetical protein